VSRSGEHPRDVDATLAGFLATQAAVVTAPTVEDARHLAWLRDALGDAFVAGVVLQTGPRAFSLGDRLQARPIACVWS
jgi:hypothetical protein